MPKPIQSHLICKIVEIERFALRAAILISYMGAIQACKKLMYVPRGWASGFIIHPLTTILDKINGKPRPPLPPPKSRMGKWRVFTLGAASSCSSLFGGDGGLLFILFHGPRLSEGNHDLNFAVASFQFEA